MVPQEDGKFAPPQEEISALSRYIAVARRRKLLVALCIVLPLLAAVVYSLSKDELYQGDAQVVINRQNLANTLTGTQDPASFANDFIRIVQTQADVARSPAVAMRVVREVPEAHLTYKEFLARSSVDPALDADIISFHVSDGSVALATKLTTAYANAFVDYRRHLDTSAVKHARLQLERRIATLSGVPGINRKLISQLNAKDEQLRTIEALETANATVVARADGAEKIAPKPVKYLIVALFGGVILAIAAAWAFEALDTRVRSASEVEERLGVPLLAHLGPPPTDLPPDGRLVALAKPRGTAAEAVRILRTNLAFAILDRDIRTIMVTSAMDQEGKSTTIANLAVTMARAGSRVALIDLDLRRPMVDTLFGLPPGPGLTDVILHRAELDDALQEIELPAGKSQVGGSPTSGKSARHISANGQPEGKLEVLRAGVLPPDPGEFIILPSVAEILHRLRDRADYVLVDAPPVLQVGDAMSLSPVVDGIFLIVRLPNVRHRMLEALRRTLAGCPAAILGFVLAGKVAIDSYGYGYGYAYGYGYQSVEDDTVSIESPAEAQSPGFKS